MKYSCVFIGVNYQTSSETIKWVESINALDKNDEILIIVVDNSCDQLDSSLESALLGVDDGLVYINTGRNLGYLPGASKGIEYLNERGIEASFVVVSNVDIRFESKNMIDVLKSQDTKGVGLFSPRIIGRGGGFKSL